MQPDDDYFKHLGTLSDGSTRQTTYRNYKNATNNYCFELNGRLKGGLDLGVNYNIFDNMNQIIRAKNKKEITVYRMTSDYEFTPSGARIAGNDSFLYQAFLSTTRSINNLFKFYPAHGTPTVLEISIPSDTVMALMENGNNLSSEEEILLGAGTEFKITNIKKIVNSTQRQIFVGPANISKCSELYHLSLEVINNPPQTRNVPPTEFFLW